MRTHLQRFTSALSVVAWLCFFSAAAPAQVEFDGDLDDDLGDEVDMDEDPVPIGDAPRGASETPVPLPEFGQEPEKTAATAKAERKRGYPMELALRPLLLDPSMTQVAIDMPALVNPFRVKGEIRAQFAVSRQVQIQLTYGPAELTEAGVTPGKGVSLGARYRIWDWLAAEASLPMWLDPFAIGVTVGAPMKITFTDKLAFIGGHDLLSVRLWRFFPVVGDPLYNEDQINPENPLLDGYLRFLGGVIYQIDPDLAFTGEIGILATDFSLTDAGVPLSGTLTWSWGTKVDLGVRAGFENLDQAAKNFGVAVTFALRI